MDVCSLTDRIMLSIKLSIRIHPITEWPSLLPASQSRIPNNVPYGFACSKIEREYEVPTFRINDHMSNLGTPSTSTVQQFRVSMLETYNLTAYYSHQGIVLDLLNLSRSVRINDA